MKIFDLPIVLASKSPRRKEILEEAGFTITVKTKDTDENYPSDMDLHEVPLFLAQKKADALTPEVSGDQIVIAADTIVINDGEIYGKPKDEKQAFDMLMKMSGKSHEVITGVCVQNEEQNFLFADQSTVNLNLMSEEEINYYIQQFKPFDKAGAYGIQEWIGLCKIGSIEGTFSNIKGLPMNKVYEHLKLFVS